MEEDQGESIKFIHKYRDDLTNEVKYCVAKANTGGKKREKGVHIIKQKDIDIDWIHELCTDQGSLDWHNKLVFKLDLNSILPLPIASMKKITDVNDVPKKKEGAPLIQFIQSEGTCGLSSLSSAFYEYFNKSIATGWMKNTIDYKTAMSQPVYTRSKRSPVMNYLKELVNQIRGNTYTVR
jgi:hypothetical protein